MWLLPGKTKQNVPVGSRLIGGVNEMFENQYRFVLGGVTNISVIGAPSFFKYRTYHQGST
jgi:hypothetical protein